MREKHWNLLDYLKRRLYVKYELKKILIKSGVLNQQLQSTYRYLNSYHYRKYARWTILPQQVNRCVITGRQWAVIKKTNLSRFKFRTESYKGNLPGFKRASW